MNRDIATRQEALFERFKQVRGLTLALCEPLEIEDYVVQSMPDVSPTKWHLAHTTWFFETFLLTHRPGFKPYDARYEVLFNSYYNTVGEQFPRHRRGFVTRPTVREVYAYRRAVDEQMMSWMSAPGAFPKDLLDVIELGLHHEQQHQELLMTDIKHVLSQTPLAPIYRDTLHERMNLEPGLSPPRYERFEGGIKQVGHDLSDGFCFDNEMPRHDALLQPFSLGDRLVTVSDYLAFIQDGGYTRHELWLSEGWHTLHAESWRAPLYWNLESLGDGEVCAFTLAGERVLHPDEPVTHVSMFEADAYARWTGGRLPREHELEVALVASSDEAREAGNFVQNGFMHPVPAPQEPGVKQLFGDGWEWTQSSYNAYPGYTPASGALGEYNGKFMCNQYVLRGGSCVTSRDHVRATYRNFFPSSARWQFTVIRVAKELE